MEELIAKINTACREAAVPLYFVVTGDGDPQTKAASELSKWDMAALTAIEVHIDLGFDREVFG
jgi:hypothetical protein